MNIKYIIDGHDIKNEFGVKVSASKGITTRPKLKEIKNSNWDNYHGQSPDLTKKYYDVRVIVLSCFITARSRREFLAKVNHFCDLFCAPGTQRLVIDVGIDMPLIYEVYSQNAIDISKSWSEANMIGTFDLELIEPEPIKRILKHSTETSKSCSITITSEKMVNIYWGDGSVDYDIYGTDTNITHTYANEGVYYPVITGCIDEISNFSTNAKIVWNKL